MSKFIEVTELFQGEPMHHKLINTDAIFYFYEEDDITEITFKYEYEKGEKHIIVAESFEKIKKMLGNPEK